MFKTDSFQGSCITLSSGPSHQSPAGSTIARLHCASGCKTQHFSAFCLKFLSIGPSGWTLPFWKLPCSWLLAHLLSLANPCPPPLLPTTPLPSSMLIFSKCQSSLGASCPASCPGVLPGDGYVLPTPSCRAPTTDTVSASSGQPSWVRGGGAVLAGTSFQRREE